MPDAPAAAAHPQPGDILAGKYRVERVIGAGGMGVVVAARHLQLDERVALKFLLPTAVVTPEMLGRFLQEARAAAKIKSDHVARVTDVGELPGGAPYMVMEYLEGSDLSRVLIEKGPLPVADAVDFVLEACEALAEAHSLGIVHRDLKPANLFCAQKTDGSVAIKVLDFGISKMLMPDFASSGLTKTSAFLGSPLYMSPEQLQQSKGVDFRTDIWSLGVILFEMLVGGPPFQANTVSELIIKIAIEPLAALRSLRPDAPADLEAVVSKALEKDRDARFQTVAELAVALRGMATLRGQLSVDGVLGTMRRSGAVLPRPDFGRGGDFSDAPLRARALGASGEAQGARPGPRAVPAETAGAFGQTAAGSRAKGKVGAGIALALVVGAMVLGVVGVSVLWGHGRTTAQAPAGAGSVGLIAAAPSLIDSSAPPVPPASSPAPSTAPPVSSATATPPATDAPRARVQPTRPATATSARAPAAAAPVSADCNPNYYFDPDGTKRWKHQCFAH